jgi:hypothetical protein
LAAFTLMHRFARWHIWLGWAIAVPMLLWMVSGLFMVARPIEQVRGNHLRIESPERPLPAQLPVLPSLPQKAKSVTIAMDGDQPVIVAELLDGTVARYDRDGRQLPLLEESAARALVAQQIVGGKAIESATFYPADKVPFDFRRAMPVWRIALTDGTRVYVGQQTGRIEAVRTRWWRVFDFMWGLHILDPQTREDTSHPLLILAAALGLVGTILGCALLFRRRKARR